MTSALFEIQDLHARPVDTEDNSATNLDILRGVDLLILEGELHALMGPNGSGKSTLANVLMGHPGYEVTRGKILFRGQDVTGLAPDERGRLGIFLGFQYPQEIPGVKVLNFMQTALSRRKGIDLSLLEIRLSLMEKMAMLEMDQSFMDRHLNEGFSGGEKKRNEILQMALLEPDLAVLDETDSGLDVDALRIVGSGIRSIRESKPTMSALVITHYRRILEYLEPDRVHVLVAGRIVESGGPELAERVDSKGFDAFRQGAGASLSGGRT